MTNPQRRKGFGFERECVNFARNHGLQATRSWGSIGDDVTISGIPYECKRRKKFPKWITEALSKGRRILCREDGGKTIIIKLWGLDE